MIAIFSSVLSKFVFLFLRASGSNSFPPPLDSSEEKKLFKECRAGNAEARDKLIMHNLRLVAHIIKKYYTSYKEQDDLISIGTIGLIKAIDSYNIESGTKFATYAGKCLQNEILMHFRWQKKISLETSIHDSVDIDKDGNPLTYLDIICGEDNIADELDRKFQSAAVLKAMRNALDARERLIISLRYGINSEDRMLPQREVAKRLNISRSYVSRIEKSALDKMNKYMNRK